MDQPILIYDDSCGFCRKWVMRLKRWDTRDRIRLLPLQADEAPRIAGVPRERLELAAHLVRPDGRVFAGAAAARELCGYLPGGALVGVIFRIPGMMPVAERTYRWIARRWGPVGARPDPR